MRQSDAPGRDRRTAQASPASPAPTMWTVRMALKKAVPQSDPQFYGLRHPHRFIEPRPAATQRSEEHTSELQSLMRISYAVFCLKNKKHSKILTSYTHTLNIC